MFNQILTVKMYTNNYSISKQLWKTCENINSNKNFKNRYLFA